MHMRSYTTCRASSKKATVYAHPFLGIAKYKPSAFFGISLARV